MTADADAAFSLAYAIFAPIRTVIANYRRAEMALL